MPSFPARLWRRISAHKVAAIVAVVAIAIFAIAGVIYASSASGYKGQRYGIHIYIGGGPTTTTTTAPSYSCNPATITYPSTGGGVCTYGSNSAIFAGTNNQYVTTYGSLGSEVANNFNSPVSGESQTLAANSASQWQVTNTTPTGMNGITGYPSNGSNSYTGEIDDYSTLSTAYNLTMPIAGVSGTNTNEVAWATSDDWLMPPNTAQGPVGVGTGYEVQVHVDTSDSSGAYTCGSHASATNASIGGSSWYVCDYQNLNSSGLCPGTSVAPNCGEMVFVLGDGTYAGKIATPTVSGTVNLLAIFQYLEDTNVPATFPGAGHPYMQAGSTLSGLSRGWEIVSTGGSALTFTNNSFSVSATGTPTPPATTPTYVSFAANNTAHTCTLTWTGDSNATQGYTGYVYGQQNGWLYYASGTTSAVFTGAGTYNVALGSDNSGGPGPLWGATSPTWSNETYEVCTVT